MVFQRNSHLTVPAPMVLYSKEKTATLQHNSACAVANNHSRNGAYRRMVNSAFASTVVERAQFHCAPPIGWCGVGVGRRCTGPVLGLHGMCRRRRRSRGSRRARGLCSWGRDSRHPLHLFLPRYIPKKVREKKVKSAILESCVVFVRFGNVAAVQNALATLLDCAKVVQIRTPIRRPDLWRC